MYHDLENGPAAHRAANANEPFGQRCRRRTGVARGKFGEMSTLMNYTYQSFNFRGRKKLRPFYDLICSIAGEEYGHIEVVSYTINLLLTGVTKRGIDPTITPLADGVNARNTHFFNNSGQTSLPIDSMGRPWTGDNVFSSGNLKLDLLHNFFLECGARADKMRTYEMVSDPTARTMVGYLLVRGGLHVVAYAKALEVLTGVEVTKLLPIPDLSNDKFPEAKKFMDDKMHLKLYTFSQEDYTQEAMIWNGNHPEDGQPLEVIQGPIPGYAPPDLDEEPQLNAPGSDEYEYDPQMFADMAKKMGIKL